MTKVERNNWIANIENAASFIAMEVGEETVLSILKRFSVSSIEEISVCNITEIFSELYAIEADLRSD